jgi:hypothetical protein
MILAVLNFREDKLIFNICKVSAANSEIPESRSVNVPCYANVNSNANANANATSHTERTTALCGQNA